MSARRDWHVEVATAPLVAWQGPAWRLHQQAYEPTDPSGSLLASGRYNRGLNADPPGPVWPALYLACRPETAIGERARHITSTVKLKNVRLTELAVRLSAVLDCREPETLGLMLDDLIADFVQDESYAVTQQLAVAAMERGAEALWVPSATLLGSNLVIFPERLRPDSKIDVVSSLDPRLHVA